MKHTQRGVTLIELIVVIMIVGLLASIAVPSYRNYLLRANRTEARAALLALAAAQEKFYLQCNTYSDTIDPATATSCSPASLQIATKSERGYYNITIIGANTTGWSATATPNGKPQSDDTKCQSFTLTSTGLKTATDAGNADNSKECWGK